MRLAFQGDRPVEVLFINNVVFNDNGPNVDTGIQWSSVVVQTTVPRFIRIACFVDDLPRLVSDHHLESNIHHRQSSRHEGFVVAVSVR